MVVLSPLLINHTHKFKVLQTDLKTEAVHCRGQGQGSSRPRPRPQNFVLKLSSRSRPVLEDPIPVKNEYLDEGIRPVQEETPLTDRKDAMQLLEFPTFNATHTFWVNL